MDEYGVGKTPDEERQQDELFSTSELVVLPARNPTPIPSPDRGGELTAELFGGKVTLQVVAQRALGELDRQMLWNKAAADWTGLIQSASTLRAYKSAWDLLLRFTQKPYWKIEQGDVIRWAAEMSAHGASHSTVNLRLAAISSFFRYVVEDFTDPMLVRTDGTHGRLTDYNPAGGEKIRAKYEVDPFEKSVYLDGKQLRAFFRAIPRDTVQGLRDFALFRTYQMTGRRNQEIRHLKWGDVDDSGEKVEYVYSGKGKFNQRREMPAPAWDAILVYLKAAGRLEGMEPGDYIFAAVSEQVRRLKRPDGSYVVGEDWAPGKQPLSAHSVNDLMKRYCRKAGIKEDRAHVHALRHSCAMLRLKSGQTLEQLADHLGHESVATTQIYIQHALKQVTDEGWESAEALLSLDEVQMPTPKRRRKVTPKA